MKEMIKSTSLFGTIMLILSSCIVRSIAENQNFNSPYGFEAPINVGDETSFGLSSAYGIESIGNTHGFGTEFYNLNNGIGYGGNSVGYGTNSYAGLNSYDNFNHHGLDQNGGFYAGSGNGFGGNFYPSSSLHGNGFGDYNLHRSYNYGNGLGNYGIHATGSSGIGIGNGGNFDGYYGNGHGYGAHQSFK